MKKKILIPTDFSATSINAIHYAAGLYCNEDVDFHILHTYYLSGYSSENLLIPEPDDADYQRVLDTSEKNMEKLKVHLRLRSENPRHKNHFSNVFGSLLDVLQNKVENEDIDLIIIGAQGENNNESNAFGSNAVSVMEKIRKCPVFAIPANVIFKSPNEIVFPTSFKTHYKHQELDYLAAVAKFTEAPIRILHISKGETLTEEQQEKKKLLQNIFTDVKYSFHNLYNVPVETGVRCFVQSRESEMIAFINKKHFFFGSVFTNPMVKQLGRFANVPLLALHDHRD